MRILLPLTWLAAVVLAGCATPVEYRQTAADRASGTVDLSYEHGFFEKPEVNEARAFELADSQCAAWGYRGAESEAKRIVKCLDKNGHGDCMKTRVTQRVQCIGTGSRLPKKSAVHQPKQLSKPVKYLYYAEQAAGEAGCSTALNVVAVETGKETYITECRGRQTLIVCNEDQCASQ